jgi:hypothetical protein
MSARNLEGAVTITYDVRAGVALPVLKVGQTGRGCGSVVRTIRMNYHMQYIAAVCKHNMALLNARKDPGRTPQH